MKTIIISIMLLFFGAVQAETKTVYINPEKTLSYTVRWDNVDTDPRRQAAMQYHILETSVDQGETWTSVNVPMPADSYIVPTAPFGEQVVWHRVYAFGVGFPVSLPSDHQVADIEVPKPHATPILYPVEPNP